MTQKITVALEDDLDGGPADEMVRFGLGGADYEIDLRASNAAAFRRQLAPFIEHARKAGRRPRRRPARTARTVSAAAISGRGRKSRAWRSATAGVSRPASLSSTKRPRQEPEAGPSRLPCRRVSALRLIAPIKYLRLTKPRSLGRGHQERRLVFGLKPDHRAWLANGFTARVLTATRRG